MPGALAEAVNLYYLCKTLGVRPHEAETFTNWEVMVMTVGAYHESQTHKQAMKR